MVGEVRSSLRARLVAAATSVLVVASGFTGFTAATVAPGAQASSTPVLEFQRDAARAAWVSGPGGNYFGVWSCPQGSLAVGVRGTEASGYVYNFGLICRYVNLDTGTWGAYTYTPTTHSGAATELRCPDGRALVRVDVWTMSGYGYPIASETEPYCQYLDFGDINAPTRTVPVLTGSVDAAPARYFGARHGSLYGRAICGTGKFVVAIDGRRGALLDGLGIYCGGFTARAASVSNVTLSGATQFGMPVTATPTAAGGPAPTMTYQWYRCATSDATTKSSIPAPPECELITGATNQSYLPQITDYGSHLRVAATATNYFGSATMVSPTTPAPSVPAPTLDLADSSDSGTSLTDNHTRDTTPTINLGALVPTAVVTVTATNGTTTVQCTPFTAAGIPDDNRGAPATGQCDLPALADGTWTVTTSQTFTPTSADPSVVYPPITSSTTSLPIVIDSTPPVIGNIVLKNGATTILDGAANSAAVSNTYTLTMPTATDAHTGVTINCSIDGGAFTTCPTSYRNLSAGEHTLTVKAVDKAGNESTKDHSWFVVTPVVIDLAPESDSGYLNTDNITNDFTPTFNVTQLVHGATVTLTATNSGQTARTCTFVADLVSSPQVTSCTFGASPTRMVDGTWTLTATQTYAPAGMTAATSTVSNTQYLYLDTVAPAYSYERIYSNGIGTFYNNDVKAGTLGWYYQPYVVFADAAGYEHGGTCSINGGAVQQLAYNVELCTLSAATSGVHTAVFTRFDKAGNVSSPQTVTWTVVNYPTLALVSTSDTGTSSSDRITSDNTPSYQLGDLTPDATVVITATRSGYPSVTCTFTAPAAVAPATASTGGCDLGMLADGAWSVTAKQTVGSTSRTSSATSITVDTARPVPTMPVIRAGTSTGAVIANESATTQTTAVIGAVSTPAGSTIQCKLDGVIVRCPTANTSFPNLSVGSHTFEVIATDTAGNVGISSTTWRVLGKPVVSLDPTSDTGAFNTDRITRDNTPQINVANLSGAGGVVTVTATKDGTSLSCTFVPTSTSGSCDLPTAIDGTWSVTAVEAVRVGASTVNSSPADAVTVTIDTVAPIKPTVGLAADGSGITPGGVVQLGPGVTSGTVTFSSAPTSEAGASILCQLDGGVQAPCAASGLGVVTNGVHALALTAVDLAGNEASSVVQWAQVEQITLGIDPSGLLGRTASGQALANSRNQTVNLTGLAGSTPVTVSATNGIDTVTCTITTENAGAGSCDFAFPSDGTWTITAKDKDDIVMNGVSASLVVDTTQPSLTVSLTNAASQLVAGTAGSATSFKTSETTLTLSTVATDLIDTSVAITCELDGGAPVSCPSTLTGLTYGEHSLKITATDDAGNTDINTLTWHVTAPPTVQLSAVSDTGASNSDGITRDSTPTFTIGNLGEDVDVVVTATKPGEADVTCYLWHANPTGPVPGTASCDFGTLVDGSWSISATQTISGRPEWISPSSAPTTVVIDTVAPTGLAASFTNGVTPGSTTTNTAIGFSAGPSASDVHAIAFGCELDGAAAGPCGSATNLTAGTHLLRYTATDLAGNATASSLSWTIIAPPTVVLKSSSDSGASSSDRVTNVSSPSIEVANLIPGALVTVTATNGSDSVSCTFEAGAPATPGDPSSSGECVLPGLANDGTWTLQAVQAIGGTTSNASASSTFTLDTQSPIVGAGSAGITAVAGGVSLGNGAGTELSAITFTLPSVEAGATRVCSIDNVTVTCPSSAAAVTGFANGSHTLEIVDTDTAGNTTEQTFTWAVVGVPTSALAPSSDSGASDLITNDDTPEISVGSLIAGATVEVVATDANSNTVSCSFIVVDSTTSCDLPPMADGAWTIKARQGFGTGWSAFSSTSTVTIDATAPADLAVPLSVGASPLIFADGDETGSSSTSVTVATPTSTDSSSVTYTCSLNGSAPTACPGSYSGLSSGDNAVTVIATDTAGNSSQITRTWSVIAPPVVTLNEASDTGVVGDGVTSQENTTFDVSNLMPGATVTVTANRSGSSPVTCTFTAPSAVSPSNSSVGSCELSSAISGLGWSVTATQSYTTRTQEAADAVALTSAPSSPYLLDVVQPHEVQISAPVSVSITEQTLTLEARSVQLEYIRTVALTSLSPSICSIDANGDVVLLSAGTCTLRGTATGGDDGGGTYYDDAVRTVSFAVLAAQTVSTVPAATVVAANPALAGSLPSASGRPGSGQRPANTGSGGQNGAPSTVGLIPPPPTMSLKIEAIPGLARARAVATVRQDVPGAPVRSVVFMIFNEAGAKIRQIAVDVAEGQTVVEATVPYANKEYQVRTFTTNEAGVSNRAPIGANVLNQPTTLGKRKDGTPILFGKKIARPVLFDPDSPELDTKAKRVLDGVVRYAAKNGGRVFITGFVRNQGGSKKDQKALSDSRAEQVAMYLSKRGVDTWIRYNGYGAYRKGQGLPNDRRVEVRWSNEEIPGLQATKANPVYYTEQEGS